MARTWVLLRGLVREMRHWQGFDEYLQAAFPDDQVVALDLPGNGSLNHLDSPTSVSGMVDSVRQQLEARGFSGPCTVVAISLGGMTAIEWLNARPGDIRQAFIINSSLSSLSPFWQRLRPANYAGLVRWGILNRDAFRKERYILEITSNLLSGDERSRRARELSVLPATSARNAFRQLKAAASFSVPDTLAAIPVTVICGARDRLVDPRCSDAIAGHWGWPLLTHPGAGHDLPLDAPEWLLETLEKHAI